MFAVYSSQSRLDALTEADLLAAFHGSQPARSVSIGTTTSSRETTTVSDDAFALADEGRPVRREQGQAVFGESQFAGHATASGNSCLHARPQRLGSG